MRFQPVLIFRFMTHPLFLLFCIVFSFLIGEPELAFWWIVTWLFFNLIFCKSSCLYGLYSSWKEKREVESLQRKEFELARKKRLEEVLQHEKLAELLQIKGLGRVLEELIRKKVLEEKLPISKVIEGVFKGVNDFMKNDEKFQEFLRSERLKEEAKQKEAEIK